MKLLKTAKRAICEDEASTREGLRGVKYFVLDEADRMLDLGFMPQVREILGLMGPLASRQNLMFSATWPQPVHSLAKEILRSESLRVSVGQDGDNVLCLNHSITQFVEIVPEARKDLRLLELIHEEKSGKCLIFVNTKRGCAELALRMRRAGVPCGEIHGNLTQAERTTALEDFTRGITRSLVATDLASRGIDVDDITLVISYDFPDSMVGPLDDYVHRIGRTGRAGRAGRSFAFFPATQDVCGTRSAGNAHELVKILQAAGQRVPPELAALDSGPPVMPASKASKGGKWGYGKGKTSGVEGSPAPKRPRLETEVTIQGLPQGSSVTPLVRFEDAPFDRKIIKELQRMGFKEPTLVQAHSWPLIIAGYDCINIAKTGSGKTLAFLLPAFDCICRWRKDRGEDIEVASRGVGPLALVIAPTRELAVQIHSESERFAKAVGARSACAFGGAAWEPQAALLEAGVELLVATPGRLAFLMGRGGEAAAALARTIAALSAERRLSQACAAFDKFVSTGGTVSRRVLSVLLNAHVVCGDLGGAAKVVADMHERGFPLGVVEYTTLLKGEFEVGNLSRAKNIIDDMLARKPPVSPDLRTVNTFLRGCLKLGDIPSGLSFYQRVESWRITLDSSTYKILMLLYAQQLRLTEMSLLMKSLNEEALRGLDNAVAFNASIAQVACVLGHKKKCKRALLRAEVALRTSVKSERNEQFDSLRRQELAQEVQCLREVVKEEESFDLVGCLARTFAFPAQRMGDPEPPSKEHSSVLGALRRGFGIEECFRRNMCSEADFEMQLKRCISKDGKLRWRRIFPDSPQLPLKLEVCSGSGDWVVAQARADVGRANWIASELRYDRVHSIMSKTVFARVNNLSLLAGDAGSLIRARLTPASLSVVCINYPQPPQTNRNASCDDAEAQLHLLTAEFFLNLHVALIDGGILTILSDNKEYTHSLARTLGTLRPVGGDLAPQLLFENSPRLPAQHLDTAEDVCGILVLEAMPGPEAGHAVFAASQFDRFFQHGSHAARYYISVVKR